MAERNLGIVDLRKLRENARVIKKRAKTKVLAVVKANAYGHGVERVANALHTVVDGFCVALTQEGISLRYAGVSLPVLVFSPPLSVCEAENCIRHDLTVTVDSMHALKRVLAAANKMQKQALVHLKAETGMHRFGMQKEELLCVFQAATAHPYCSVTGVYTHFADVSDERFTQEQFNAFLQLSAPLKAVSPHLLLHAGATGALRYKNRFCLDAVRPGIGLYGYGMEEVKPVLSLHAPVLKRGNALTGERLGYGKPITAPFAYTLTRFGYADGGLRSGGTCTPRCMDVSFLPSGGKDRVEIIGKSRTAEEIAKEEGTIPYEVLCRYTMRATLTYLN